MVLLRATAENKKKMEIKLDFNPEEVAQKMTEAIITSTFKEIFAKAVTEECKRLTENSWSANNVIQTAVREYMRDTIRGLLNTEYKEQIGALIRTKITGERLEKLTDELVEKIIVESRY